METLQEDLSETKGKPLEKSPANKTEKEQHVCPCMSPASK